MKETERFEKSVAESLKKVGWYPGRRIPDEKLQQWETELAEHNVGLNTYAKEFLKEFGGLEIKKLVEPYSVAFIVVPTKDIEFDLCTKEYEPEVGCELSPLGESPGHAIFAVGEDGRVYLLGDWYWIVGDNVAEAMNNIVLNIPSRKG